jgi:hypothetical protein
MSRTEGERHVRELVGNERRARQRVHAVLASALRSPALSGVRVWPGKLRLDDPRERFARGRKPA